jgi:hypothetical protein
MTRYRIVGTIDLDTLNGHKFEIQVSPTNIVLVEIGGQRRMHVLAVQVKPRPKTSANGHEALGVTQDEPV